MLAIIILISLVLIGVGLISYFYGNQDNAEQLKSLLMSDCAGISESIASDIKGIYEENVSDVRVEVKGKIIYIIMNVNDGVSKIDAEGYAVKALEKFKSEDLEYYDVQFLITCSDEKKEEDEKAIYPIAGAKKAKGSQIIWSNN